MLCLCGNVHKHRIKYHLKSPEKSGNHRESPVIPEIRKIRKGFQIFQISPKSPLTSGNPRKSLEILKNVFFAILMFFIIN